jgi:TM2 domain-containing membrane protein YozV
MSDKRVRPLFLLALFFGFFGVHRFYAGKVITGVLQLLTFGGFGIWWLIDLLLIVCGVFKDGEGRVINIWSNDPASGSTRRIQPLLLLHHFLGVFGAHRFYAGKIGTGILQLLTFGGFGIWALIDFLLIVCNSFTDAEGKVVNEW